MDNVGTTRSKRSRNEESARRIERCVVLGVALVYCITASVHSFWLDSSELSAASFSLGIPHPPGHPLFVYAAKLLTWLPLGPIAFRVSLVSGLFGLLSSWLVFRIGSHIGARVFGWSRELSDILAAFSAIAFALSEAVWFQSVRPEVYTLQSSLNLAILYFLLRMCTSTLSQHRAMYFIAAAFFLGLGGINHHYLALFTLPAGLWVFLKQGLTFSRRTIVPAALSALSPLLLYAFLPIRAEQNPYINWVNPQNWERALDVILARVFQGSVTDHPEVHMGWNFLQSFFTLLEHTHPASLPLGLLGLYWIIRNNRQFGTVVLLFTIGNLLSTSLMPFDRLNPDTWGYLQSSLGVWCVASGLGLGWFVQKVHTHLSLQPAFQKTGTGLLGIALVASLLSANWNACSLQGFEDTERIEDVLLGGAPPNALYLSSFFNLYFVHWHAQVVDGRRPDLVIGSQSFDAKVRGGIPHAESMTTRSEFWAPIYDAYRLSGRIPVGQIRAFATVRPVLFEPESQAPLLAFGVPDGWNWRVHENPSSISTQSSASLSPVSLASPLRRETQTVLAWHYYQTAHTALDRGLFRRALQAINAGASVVPESPKWNQLKGAIPPSQRSGP